jgi:hypothetical protein
MKEVIKWAKAIGLAFVTVLIIAALLMPGIPNAIIAYARLLFVRGDNGKNGREAMKTSLLAAAKRAEAVKSGDAG